MGRTHVSFFYAISGLDDSLHIMLKPRKKAERPKGERRRMGMSRNWFRRFGRKLRSTSRRDIIFLHQNASPTNEEEDATLTEETQTPPYNENKLFFVSEEESSAIKIQACFRGHLARRAFRALKSLVKLQALARGVCVRRQTRIALHFMHTLVRLQVRVRARQLLNGCNDATTS